jgi:hypothetical protein
LTSYAYQEVHAVGVHEGDLLVPLEGIRDIGPETPEAVLRSAPRSAAAAVTSSSPAPPVVSATAAIRSSPSPTATW